MFKKIQNRMVQVAAVCSSLVIVLILLHIFLGRSVLKYADKLKLEFKLSQNKLQESEALIRNFPNPQRAIEDIEKKTQELRDIGVTRKQLPRIIQLLGRSTGELNINVISIRPRDDIKRGNENLPPGVSKVYIEMVVTCSYQLMGECIKALSALPVAFVIESISIEKKERGFTPSESKVTSKELKEKPEELLVTLLLSTYMIWEI